MTPQDELLDTIRRVIIGTVWLRFWLLFPLIALYVGFMVYVLGTIQ